MGSGFGSAKLSTVAVAAEGASSGSVDGSSILSHDIKR